MNPLNVHPYRKGFGDAIFNRPCKSPWAEKGWPAITKNRLYVEGFMRGQESGVRFELDGEKTDNRRDL